MFLELFAGSGGLSAKVAKVASTLPPQDILSDGVDFSDRVAVEAWCDALAAQLKDKSVVFHVALPVPRSLEPEIEAIVLVFAVRLFLEVGTTIRSRSTATALPRIPRSSSIPSSTAMGPRAPGNNLWAVI